MLPSGKYKSIMLKLSLIELIKVRFLLLIALLAIALPSSIYSYDLLSVKFVNNDIGYISGSNGYLSKTTDGGLTWGLIETNSPYDMWDICPLGENTLITACSDGKILKTTDGGISWESKIEGVNDIFKNIFFTYDSRLIVCGENSNLFISNDYGETWERIMIPVYSDLNKIFFLDGIYGFIVGSNGTLLASTDGGITWNLKMFGTHRINFTSISMIDDKTGTISGEGGIILNTYNGWLTCKKYEALSGNQVINEVRYMNSTDAVAAGTSFILRTTNNGRDWYYAQLPINSYVGTFNSIFFPSISKGFVVGANGVKLMTTDQGQTWNYIDITDKPDGKLTSTVKQNDNGITITQNYPNPFNPSTVISFSVNTDSFVKFKVYDIAGKEVSSLVDEYKSAGNYTVQFNASGLPSGVYFCKVSSDNQNQSTVKTMRMLLVK